MADNVSNQEKAIVTDGTAHKLVTKGNETTFNPSDATMRTHTNHVYSKGKLKEGRSFKTLIKGKKVCLVRTLVGLESEGGEAPHTFGLVSKMPYQQHAKARLASTDVKFEGDYVVRTDDPTWQDRDYSTREPNWHGTVDGSELTGAEDVSIEFLKRKCTITGFTGHSGDRKLGKKSAQAKQINYLEILTGETLEFIVIHKDLTTQPPVDAGSCIFDPKHVSWKAVREGGESAKTDTLTKDNVTTFKIEKSFTELPGCQNPRNVTAIKDTEQKEGVDKTFNSKAGTTTTGLGVGLDERGIGAVKIQTPVGNLDADWRGFINLYKYQTEKVSAYINVSATACSNPKTAEIRLYPSRRAEFKLTFPKVTEKLKAGKALPGVAQKIRALLLRIETKIFSWLNKVLPVKIGVEYKFFDGLELNITGQFLHCNKVAQYGRKWVSPAHCGLVWRVAMTGQLVWAEFTVGFPLAPFVANLVNIPFPGVGTALSKGIKKIEDWLGVELKVEFTVGFNVSIAGNVGRTRHGAWNGTGPSAIFGGSFGVHLVTKIGGLTGKVGCTLHGTVEILISKAEDPEHLLGMNFFGKAWVTFKAELAYKGKFSTIGTFGSWLGSWSDYIQLSPEDGKGERTVTLKYERRVKEWNPSPKQLPLGFL